MRPHRRQAGEAAAESSGYLREVECDWALAKRIGFCKCGPRAC